MDDRAATESEYIGDTSNSSHDTSNMDVTAESDIEVISISSASEADGGDMTRNESGGPESLEAPPIDPSLTQIQHAFFPKLVDEESPFENPFLHQDSEESAEV
jgi:hypothetical protein